MTNTTEVLQPEVKVSGKSIETLQDITSRPMFADCILENNGSGRRTLATVISFVLECSLLGFLILLPLMFTEALPKQQLLSFLVAPPPPPPPPPPAAAAPRVVQRAVSEWTNGQLRTPTRIPQKVQMIKEEEAPPPALAMGGVIGGVPGGIPGGQLGGVIGGIVSATSNLTVVPKLAQPVMPKRVRISQGVTEGRVLQKIQPEYPVIARSARIQGQVVLRAIISRTGEIQNLSLVSGHPMLVPSAIKAVSQWRYRPYLLDGEPVEVDTTITVTFTLS